MGVVSIFGLKSKCRLSILNPTSEMPSLTGCLSVNYKSIPKWQLFQQRTSEAKVIFNDNKNLDL